MNFPDATPDPSPSFPPLSFPGRYVHGFPNQFPVNCEQPGSHLQHANVPKYKGARNSENEFPVPGHLSPLNQLTDSQEGKGTSHIFYKTRICAKFLRRTCRGGELCTFAHGLKDLREPPPNWQEFVPEKDRGPNDWNDEERFIRTMKICRRYFNGEECPYRENCNFLHEVPPKFKNHTKRQRESSTTSIITAGPFMGNRSKSKQLENKHVNPNSDAFLIRPICSEWEITGQCSFGESCYFTHARSELHLPSGDIEAEAVVQSGPSEINSHPIPVVVPSPDNPVPGAPNREAERKLKNIRKQKYSRKISGVYGDWLDGFIPPHEFPGRD